MSETEFITTHILRTENKIWVMGIDWGAYGSHIVFSFLSHSIPAQKALLLLISGALTRGSGNGGGHGMMLVTPMSSLDN